MKYSGLGSLIENDQAREYYNGLRIMSEQMKTRREHQFF